MHEFFKLLCQTVVYGNLIGKLLRKGITWQRVAMNSHQQNSFMKTVALILTCSSI